jgi:hypothetical protein
MKPPKNSRIVGEHYFPTIATNTQELLSDDGQTALVLINSSCLTSQLRVQVKISQGQIKTSVSIDY